MVLRMSIKLLTVVVSAALCGAVVLEWRHERRVMNHEMAMLHRQINQQHEVIWDYQVKITWRTSPDHLRGWINRSELELEPYIPTDEVDPRYDSRRLARAGE